MNNLHVPSRATHARFTYSPNISISWPSWDGRNGWDVWDSHAMSQGARCVRHGVSFEIAEGVALEWVQKLERENKNR